MTVSSTLASSTPLALRGLQQFIQFDQYDRVGFSVSRRPIAATHLIRLILKSIDFARAQTWLSLPSSEAALASSSLPENDWPVSSRRARSLIL
jgi:hypothetical protein